MFAMLFPHFLLTQRHPLACYQNAKPIRRRWCHEEVLHGNLSENDNKLVGLEPQFMQLFHVHPAGVCRPCPMETHGILFELF